MRAETAEAAARQATPESGLSHPSTWLRELARMKPAPWPWGRAVRAAFCVGAPFSVGYACDAIITGMWISMGTLMMAAGEPAGSYRFVFRQLALSGLIGALGYLAGGLAGLPWGVTVAAMAALGFLGGVLSGYGAIWSLGSMQALLVASIAIGVPGIGPYWWLSVLYLVGMAFYMAVLAVEALLFPQRPQRQAQAALIGALARLADVRAQGDAAAAGGTVEAARQKVTDGLSALAALMLESRSSNGGHDGEADRLAALLQGCDTLFAAILWCPDRETLRAAVARLDALAAAVAHGRAPEGAPPEGARDPVADTVRAVTATMRAVAESSPPSDAARGSVRAGGRLGMTLGRTLDRLAPGWDNLRAALALGLCMGLAYAAHWVDRQSHWFWIPLTVSLVMKPDLGSVFARAVLRCVGTIGGAAFGAAVLVLLPKGQPVILVIAALAAVLPWTMRRSYVLQAVVLAPLVLLLVDIIEPGPRNMDYAAQRVLDTFIGGAIVLVFGYFLWPRARGRRLARSFHGAKALLADYLLAACGLRPGSGPSIGLSDHRRRIYGRLADMRTGLRTAMMEPPPACTEAGAWFPIVAGAERLCDRITAFSALPGRSVAAEDEAALRQLARYVAATPQERDVLAPPQPAATPTVAALAEGVLDELAHMGRLQEPGGFPRPPAARG
ncbi:FUSC family protein [Xanthobacter agilis]|uniref:Membrane protein YccC n=1 Tax=Xanthobacter agilis TaxID=47492 RepID=A0ABU0LCK0_XANAG|nr:FUSC family protein [Xanthobacter agilis]MDQ0504780.1 putative membrane protein YccC [Xanthobacter agilis]